MLLTAMLTMIGLGTLFAVVLAVANEKLKVTEDPRIAQLTDGLPGLNCGACGFPSCHAFATAIVEKKEEALNGSCAAGGAEAAEFVSRFTGVRKKHAKTVAVVFCGARHKDKTKKADYKGIGTCRSAHLLSGGGMNCDYGCLGYGDCVLACAFDAMKMVNGLPVIDPAKCVACGACVKACPRDIIELMPYHADNLVVPACRSKDKGAVVRKICSVGCIACKICEKLSDGVITVGENLATLNTKRLEDKVDWEEVIKKCPTKTIVRVK